VNGKIKAHFQRHEIFYTSIRTAVAMIFLLILALITELAIK